MSTARVDRAMRLPIQLLVECQKDGQALDEFCVNLSSTGIFIETKNIQNKGDVLDINFTLPHSQEKIVLKGTVMWVRAEDNNDGPAGMGLKFDEDCASEYEKLEQAIQYYNEIKNR